MGGRSAWGNGIACRSWIQRLFEVARHGGNKKELARCGLLEWWPSRQLNDTVVKNLVIVQNGVMYSFWRLCFCVMRSRASSLVRFTSGVPHLLAGILHHDKDKAKKSMDLFGRITKAYDEAALRTDGKVVAILNRSPLKATVVRFAVLFAKAAKFEKVSPQLDELLRSLFMAVGQTKIIEDSIRDLRDKESRQGTSKVLGHFTAWHSSVGSGVAETYRRPQVAAQGNAAVDPTFQAENLFKVTHTSDGSGDSVPLRGILQGQDWTTFSAQSVKNTVADIQLLLYLHDNNLWHKVASSCLVQLLPEGEVVFDEVHCRKWGCENEPFWGAHTGHMKSISEFVFLGLSAGETSGRESLGVFSQSK